MRKDVGDKINSHDTIFCLLIMSRSDICMLGVTVDNKQWGLPAISFQSEQMTLCGHNFQTLESQHVINEQECGVLAIPEEMNLQSILVMLFQRYLSKL